MIVLGIESSCDECSMALVKEGKTVLGLSTFSQIETHKTFYGVVPEIASRIHAKTIDEVFRDLLEKSQISPDSIDLIAVTNRPGLIGSLIVGVYFAKGLALSLKKPIVGVDHILAHLYSPFLSASISQPSYPYLVVLVSGGHTVIAKQNDFDYIEVLGTTLDDACGEVFDKVAKYYDLGFPGGPAIDFLAQQGNEETYNFPIPFNKSNEQDICNLSYSGLKTAVIHQSHKFLNPHKKASLANLCASFQKAAFTHLINSIERASRLTGLKQVVLGGGVIANSYLRKALKDLSQSRSISFLFPELKYCTDNGAMIAGLGFFQYLKTNSSDNLQLKPYSRVKPYKKFLK